MATTLEREAGVEREVVRVTERRPRVERYRLGRASLYVVLTILGVVAALPFVWMILASFKSGTEIRQTPPTFWPQEASLDNYRTILTDPQLPLWLFYRNSLFIAVMNVIATLFTGSLLGYIFAKFTFTRRTRDGSG